MGKSTKPRKAYRPRKMIIPPAFATTCDMDTPTEHKVAMESRGELRSALVEVARAMAAIKARHTATGRVGCSGEERQSILMLADLMDEMRVALPRRLWLAAYREALDRPVVRVETDQEASR